MVKVLLRALGWFFRPAFFDAEIFGGGLEELDLAKVFSGQIREEGEGEGDGKGHGEDGFFHQLAVPQKHFLVTHAKADFQAGIAVLEIPEQDDLDGDAEQDEQDKDEKRPITPNAAGRFADGGLDLLSVLVGHLCGRR